MRKSKTIKIISLIICFALVISYIQIGATALTLPDAKGETVKVDFMFAFFRSEPNLSFSTIKKIFWHGRKVIVLDYSGDFVYVQDLESENEGYIHKMLLNDKPLNIRQQYINIYKGASKEGIVTINYEKDGVLNWSVSKNGIVEVTKYSDRSLSVKGISPGTVTLTVRCDGNKDTCDISCIEKWSDTGTATAQSPIKIMSIPGKYYNGAKTIPEGATITAHGNIPGKNDYVYVSSGDILGFIKLSEFPAIKYMITQYHYYDKGYALRFGSAETKIYDYASVLDDVMMAYFNLKVCPYVEQYTSAADQCKIWRYGSVTANNLASSCPQNDPHKTNSCLQTHYLREDMISKFGNGRGTVSKVVWTGHIMSNHESDRSQSTVGIGNIIITPYATTNPNNNFSNYTSSKVRRESLFTLVHETSHQLGLYDHYCAGDFAPPSNRCSNKHCSKCYGSFIPKGCIMYERLDIEDISLTNLYCNDCKKNILNTVNNF